MITKTDFLLFLDAPLHLWAEKHDQLEKAAPEPYALYLMQQGGAIEQMALEFLDTYIPQQYANPSLYWQQTYEDGIFQARVDAVVFDEDAQAWDIYEIKSSTSYDKQHLYDLTFQRLVSEANVPIRNVYIVHVNKEYIRQGEIDLSQYFIVEDLTEKTREMKAEVSVLREEAHKVSTTVNPAEVTECVKPKNCPCPTLCHPDLPEHAIYNIPRLSEKKKRQLKAMGVLAIKDIPEDYTLTEKQLVHVQAVKAGEALIDVKGIRNELAKLHYPLYFLDYETCNPGIPAYDGYAPYQHMVFQYSLHVFEEEGKDYQHYECLVTDQVDPGKEIAAHLVENIGDTGSVIVWNKAFEATRNKEMAAMYPDYADALLNINERMYDLMEIFSKGYYIHPDFHGSFSIKNILPVLVEDLTYDGLPIPKGDEAMMAWLEIMKGLMTAEKLEETKENLLRYCELDTMAMVKNWEVLKETVG